MDGGAIAIEVLVQNLINVLKEEYSLLRGLDGDAQQLQRTLGMIQAYLSDAENKSITQHAVKIWLGELETVAFNADNVLDELSYHLLHKKVKKMMTPKDRVLSYFSSYNHISARRNMAHTIKQINADFESMNKRATYLGLQSIIQNAPVADHTSIETDSISRDAVFVGRDDDVPKLLDMLTHIPKDRTFSIIALVGMGGMGKTTLTRNVFNHDRVKAQFGSLIWVHVSQTFDPISLFKKILYKLTKRTSDGVESRDDILEMLQEALKAKTYLLILDDAWNEDVSKWRDFINSMAGVTSTKGNGIIITTRSENVASIVDPFHVHFLKGLSDDDCWSIIKAYTCDENGNVLSRLETIGKEIAKGCHGLPIAANVVAGVLRRCKTEQEWHFIKENGLLDCEEGENISVILKLSFYHLSSPSLKKCFAYCSVFPKGHHIVKQELIELWMAEGFLQPSRRNDMESVGNMFFNVLLHNSLLQVAMDEEYLGRECCVMHDLVHDLASSVLSNADGNTPVQYMFFKEDTSRIPEEMSRNLRTLLLHGRTSGTIFPYFKCLHNLTLSHYDYTELPDSIRNLIHLRNLNISHTRIENLPEWIGEFHHLQTLRAETWKLRKLPSTLTYLISLRHLFLSWETEFPAQIGRLTSLQTLPHFEVGKEKGYQIEELGSLKNLQGSLQICHLEKVRNKEEAMKANMSEKSNLSKLVFSWDEGSVGERNDESVLEGLRPHANLKVLEIERFKGKRFPAWSEKMAVWDGLQCSWVPLGNLIEIKIRDCSECEEIPMLEHLPNLKSLYLLGLKKLRLINPSYESLEELIIGDCPNLKSIQNPSCRAEKYHRNLRKLIIEGCGELMELPCQMLESFAPTIEILRLARLRSLKNLPLLIDCLAKSSHRLVEMTISGVPNFMASGTVKSWDFGRLKELYIDVSEVWSTETSVGIRETVDGILKGCCNSLTHLCLKGMENWEWLPQSIQHLTALTWLELENIGLEELPQWLGRAS